MHHDGMHFFPLGNDGRRGLLVLTLMGVMASTLAMALLFILLGVHQDERLNWAWWPILGWGIGVLKHYLASRPRGAVGV